MNLGDATTVHILRLDGTWLDITNLCVREVGPVLGWPDGPPAQDETGGMTIEELIPEAVDEWRQVRDDR